MARYQQTIFVCTNERTDGRACCKKQGASELLATLKETIKEQKLQKDVRAMASGCLNMCDTGCAAVVYSDHGQIIEVWYGNLKPDQAQTLLACHMEDKRLETHVIYAEV